MARSEGSLLRESLLADLSECMRQGLPLSAACRRHPFYFFSRFFCNVVGRRTGGQSRRRTPNALRWHLDGGPETKDSRLSVQSGDPVGLVCFLYWVISRSDHTPPGRILLPSRRPIAGLYPGGRVCFGIPGVLRAVDPVGWDRNVDRLRVHDKNLLHSAIASCHLVALSGLGHVQPGGVPGHFQRGVESPARGRPALASSGPRRAEIVPNLYFPLPGGDLENLLSHWRSMADALDAVSHR